MRNILAAIALGALATPTIAQESPDVELWQLDCGKIELSDAGDFSDAHLYDGEPRTLSVGCYLVRNGDEYMLWDAGLSGALAGGSHSEGGATLSLDSKLTDQIGKLGLSPDDISLVAVSHYHFDHIGQLADFPNSTLLINKNEWEVVSSPPEGDSLIDTAPFAPWLKQESAQRVRSFAKDEDVFGDGSVLIKAMPGHTPGHSTLLVRLPESGDVMLTGDLYHFEEQVENRGVPGFNFNRADTLASMARFDAMAEALGATVVIQHDPRHLSRLPAFPESAK